MYFRTALVADGLTVNAAYPSWPPKASIQIFFQPIGRVLLQIPHHVRHAMHRAQTGQQVHVIFHATDNLGDALHAPDDSTQVRMQSRSPLGPNERSSFLRRENNVVMQTEES